MRETWVRSLSWEGPLEEGNQSTSIFLPGESPWTEDRGDWQATVHGVAESDMTEWLSKHEDIALPGKGDFAEVLREEYWNGKITLDY